MNKAKHSKKMLSFILCIVLITAMALMTTGCNGSTAKDAPSSVKTKEKSQTKGSVLGEGNTKFIFTVVDQEGSETQFEIHTDKETVGEALLELDLIAGDESKYGLYIKTVNGITLDNDKDGVYWAFYINGEYAQTGVDSTKIAEEANYSLKVESI